LREYVVPDRRVLTVGAPGDQDRDRVRGLGPEDVDVDLDAVAHPHRRVVLDEHAVRVEGARPEARVAPLRGWRPGAPDRAEARLVHSEHLLHLARPLRRPAPGIKVLLTVVGWCRGDGVGGRR